MPEQPVTAQTAGPFRAKGPVVSKAGGPYVCKRESGKKYFGVLVAPGAEVPRCPHCKKACTPAQEPS